MNDTMLILEKQKTPHIWMYEETIVGFALVKR